MTGDDKMTAYTEIRSMIDRPYKHTNIYAPIDIYDVSLEILRDLLTENGDTATIDFDYHTKHNNLSVDQLKLMTEYMARHVTYLLTDDINRSDLSRLALELSLCPVHLCDYVACFDDDEPDCRTIRSIFPSHDS